MNNYESSLRNDKVSLKLRKSARDLYSAGIGIAGYAVWGVLRVLLRYYFDSNNILDDFTESVKSFISSIKMLDGTASRVVFVVLAILIVLFVVSLGLGVTLLEVYVGITACRECLGKKKGVVYIILAFFLVFFNLLAAVGNAYAISSMMRGTDFYIDQYFDTDGIFEFLNRLFNISLMDFASLLLSLTNAVIGIELIVNAFKVKALRKKMAGGGISEH
jgi:hypothetical protein